MIPEGIDNPSAEDVMRATRDAGFGDEVKRRIAFEYFGAYATSSGYYDAYYGQAQKVRTLISGGLRRGVRKGRRADLRDSTDHRVRDWSQGRRPRSDVPDGLATIPANLSGVPGISVPSGLADDSLPAGVQILAPTMADDRVYRVGAALEAMLAEKWGSPLLDGRLRC